jgi:hypothetical protein
MDFTSKELDLGLDYVKVRWNEPISGTRVSLGTKQATSDRLILFLSHEKSAFHF